MGLEVIESRKEENTLIGMLKIISDK